MITFILSLSVVERQQRRWRVSQRNVAAESFFSRLAIWSWLDPEPYQDSSDSTWKHSERSSTQSAPDSLYEGWYRRKKHRAMAKLEISDAFDMRGRVLVALLACLMVSLLAISYLCRSLVFWLTG